MQRLDLRGEGGSPLPQLCGMEAQEPAPLKGSHRLVLGCLRRLSGWTDDISGMLSSLFLAHRTISASPLRVWAWGWKWVVREAGGARTELGAGAGRI